MCIYYSIILCVTLQIVEATGNWQAHLKFLQNVYPKVHKPEHANIFREETRKHHFERCVRNLHKNGGRVWFALAGSNIVGSIAARRGKWCSMNAFYVAPLWQSKGVGKDLFREVVEFTSNRLIRIEVVEYLEKTIQLYRKWGFAQSSEEPVEQPWEADAPNFAKEVRCIIMTRAPKPF